jgi:hypothetical protein
MTRRNDKRNNRHNSRQRNNNTELNPFAQMLLGALLGKGAGMFTEALMKKAEEKTEDKPHTGIRQSDNLLESSCIINGDGSATEIPIPDGFQIFISEDGKPMIRKKIEGDEKKTPDAAEGNPITYRDILKKLFLNKESFFIGNTTISSVTTGVNSYSHVNNCTSEAQAKRIIAFNKLQNIAKYLNGGWKPNFKDGSKNWYIYKDILYGVTFNHTTNQGIVYFKNADLADEAIRLMGKDSLNDLFSTDW